MIQSKTAVSATKKPASSAKVIYLPRQVEKVADSLRLAVEGACGAFDAAMSSGDKDYLRALHIQAKLGQSGSVARTAKALFEKHRTRFRNGSQIDPSKIKPVLKFVRREEEWSDLFYATRSMWSMPYNKGYGRRLRFVVFDEYHEAVIGIIGLQSPPADLAARDELWNYPQEQKLALVNCTLDAYAVGAIPPYSYLLGGKLCAGMISSDPIRQAYWRQYAGKKTRMLDQNIQQPLAAVTTTSAFGRSSQYNRLKYKDRLLAEPIGYTMGFGTIHLEHLYSELCAYLKMVDGFTKGGFGNGPKVRWQNICRALVRLGLSNTLLQHGVRREVFLYRLVDQLHEGMAGKGFGSPIGLPEADFADYWRERWAVPRAQRFPSWNQGDDVELLRQTLASAVSVTAPASTN